LALRRGCSAIWLDNAFLLFFLHCTRGCRSHDAK
jgi:hypothetical protein